MSDTEKKETLESVLQGFTMGQAKSLLTKVWKAAGQTEEGLRAVLGPDRKIIIETIIRKLLDRHSRGIPQEEMTGSTVPEDKSFKLTQPQWDYVKRLLRLQEFFPMGTRFVTAAEFQTQSEALIAKLGADELMKPLLKRVHLPVALPHLPGFNLKEHDYGKTFEDMFLSAARGSYLQCFANSDEPDKSRKFNNYRTGELEGQVTVIDGTRHDQLLAAMAKGPTVALFWPNPMQGFSIPAAREFIAYLPKEFLLAGGFDTATAMAAYPDVLARDYQTPGNDMAALQWQSAENSLNFEASDEDLDFVAGYLDAYDNYSAGLLLLAEESPRS